MDVRRGRVCLIDFNPRIRTRPGQVRPAVVLQSDFVSEAGHPSTVVVPTTTRLAEDAGLLRLRLTRSSAGIDHDSDVLVGQVIAIANESFRRELVPLDAGLTRELERRVSIVLAL